MHVFQSSPLRCLAILFILLLLPRVPAPAQDATQPATNIETRFLFIFDTSSAMKKRIPNVEFQINALFATRLGGYLEDGDNIAVWTFNHNLETGEMPLQRWSAKNDAIVTDNLKTFMEQHEYHHSTSFKCLQPYLNQVVLHSKQLIIFVLSDGDGDFVGSPFDHHINDIFRKEYSNLRRSKQPFVLVLGVQRGGYTGANLGLPPGVVNIPALPPWPLPPPPATNPPPPVVEKPPVLLPPLIIIGTNPPPRPVPQATPPPTPKPAPVELPQPAASTAPESQPPAQPIPVTPPPPLEEVIHTNLPPPVQTTPEPEVVHTPEVTPIPTATEAAPTPASVPKEPATSVTSPATPAVAPTPAAPEPPTTMESTPGATNAAPMAGMAGPNDSGNGKLLIGIGIGLLIAAAALAILIFWRSRRPPGSLISDSMRQK